MGAMAEGAVAFCFRHAVAAYEDKIEEVRVDYALGVLVWKLCTLYRISFATGIIYSLRTKDRKKRGRKRGLKMYHLSICTLIHL